MKGFPMIQSVGKIMSFLIVTSINFFSYIVAQARGNTIIFFWTEMSRKGILPLGFIHIIRQPGRGSQLLSLSDLVPPQQTYHPFM